MPNHITNVLKISCYEHRGAPAGLVDEILAAIKSEDSPFDFNRVLPMPRELQITSGGVTSDALALDSDEEAVKMLSFPWAVKDGITSAVELRAALRKRYLEHPQEGFATLDDFAARVRSNIDKYGTPDWYSWCNDNWGTKWNAYAVVAGKTDDNEAVIHFETAWAPPIPVLDALAEKYPKACLRLIWSDEGDDTARRVYWADGKQA